MNAKSSPFIVWETNSSRPDASEKIIQFDRNRGTERVESEATVVQWTIKTGDDKPVVKVRSVSSGFGEATGASRGGGVHCLAA